MSEPPGERLRCFSVMFYLRNDMGMWEYDGPTAFSTNRTAESRRITRAAAGGAGLRGARWCQAGGRAPGCWLNRFGQAQTDARIADPWAVFAPLGVTRWGTQAGRHGNPMGGLPERMGQLAGYAGAVAGCGAALGAGGRGNGKIPRLPEQEQLLKLAENAREERRDECVHRSRQPAARGVPPCCFPQAAELVGEGRRRM